MMWVWLGLALASVTGAPAEEPAKTLKNSVGLELVLIPAGEFDIGSPDSTAFPVFAWEKPQHRVKISKAFYLGKFEVTQEQYEKVMGKNPSCFCKTGASKDQVKDLDTSRFPVEYVSWDEAQAFCAKLSNLEAEKKAGRVYRLPTSAEWEYACRAGTTTVFHFGDVATSKQGNFGGPFGADEKGPTLGRPTTVGSYAPNAWGLYDMHGNVWEWCQDYMGPDYYRQKVKVDPQGPKTGPVRVVRGASWHTVARYGRSAARLSPPTAKDRGHIGFRVVCAPADRTP